MAIRNQAFVAHLFAVDVSTGLGKTGDAANITVHVVQDGGAAAEATNSVSEVDATNLPGWYEVTLTADEMDADSVLVSGKSSTADVRVDGEHIATESGDLAVIAAAISGLNDISASDVWHFEEDSILVNPVLGRPMGAIVKDILQLVRSGNPIDTGTALGGTANTITLPANAPATDITNTLVVLIGGTGEGQVRTVIDYDTGTKIAIADRDWDVIPDNTSEYQIVAAQVVTLAAKTLLGPGLEEWTLVVKDEFGNVIPEANVWITYTANIKDVAAGPFRTNDQGVVVGEDGQKPLVDPGVTYYLWAEKNGQFPVVAKAVTPTEA